jgi:hypothetical protein
MIRYCQASLGRIVAVTLASKTWFATRLDVDVDRIAAIGTAWLFQCLDCLLLSHLFPSPAFTGATRLCTLSHLTSLRFRWSFGSSWCCQ